MKKRIYIDPWVKLMARRHRMRVQHWHNPYRSAQCLDRAVQKARQRLLGSDISLVELVQQNVEPMEESVVRLSRYLAKRAAYFIAIETNNHKVDDPEEYCFWFFYYTIQLYAHCHLGGECVDNLIQMAEAHERNPEILAIILEWNLPDGQQNLEIDCWSWVFEYDQNCTPVCFKKAVQAAVAVLTGVMKDPLA